MPVNIRGGEVLVHSEFMRIPVSVVDGQLAVDRVSEDAVTLDAEGLMVLPGIVDIHGDAFERQIEPRPGVQFPMAMAFAETDRQLIANGITTACHAVTCSWEPGLRSVEGAGRIVDALDRARDKLAADAHFHLRHEVFNLDAEPQILEWIRAGRVSALAFNDHMDDITRSIEGKTAKLGRMVEKTGLTQDDYLALVERVLARRAEIPASIARISAVAQDAGIPLFSHDDRHVEDRAFYRSLGSRVSEFPKTVDAARDAIEAGEATVFGAPNVVRGGSQNKGSPSAVEMAKSGLCSVLASDYFYPALPQAAYKLSREHGLSLAAAWALISTNPASAMRFADRGKIASGLRADLILARLTETGIEVVATLVKGRLVHITEPFRIAPTLRRGAETRRVA
ncbi:MAG: alpha-D-ribose 1-methylphosphonate 5-triphosphate diphosphatase [Rhabdaerophilum sp.]